MFYLICVPESGPIKAVSREKATEIVDFLKGIIRSIDPNKELNDLSEAISFLRSKNTSVHVFNEDQALSMFVIDEAWKFERGWDARDVLKELLMINSIIVRF